MQDVEERMQALGSSDVCALFLLSVESREAGKVIDLENGAERAASLLSRFFRITDIVGYLGENRFAASSGRRRPRSARRCGSPRSRRQRRRSRAMSAFMSSAPMTTNSRPSFARRSTPWRWPTRTQTAAFTSTPCRARNRPFSAPPRNRSPHRCCAATSTRACASSRWGRGRASSTSAPVITAAWH